MDSQFDLVDNSNKNFEMELGDESEMNSGISSLNFDNTSNINEMKSLVSVSSLGNISDYNEPALESSIVENGENNDNNNNLDITLGNIFEDDDGNDDKDADTDRSSQLDTGRTSEYDRDSFLTFLTSIGFVYDKEREESSQLLNEMCDHVDYTVNKEIYERSEVVILMNELCSDVDEIVGGENRRKFECNCILQEMLSFIDNTNNRIIIEEDSAHNNQYDDYDENISLLTGIGNDEISLTSTANGTAHDNNMMGQISPSVAVSFPSIDLENNNNNSNNNNDDSNIYNLTLVTDVTSNINNSMNHNSRDRPGSPEGLVGLDRATGGVPVQGASQSFQSFGGKTARTTGDTKTKITLIQPNNYDTTHPSNDYTWSWSDMKEVGRVLYEIVDRVGFDGGDSLSLTGIESMHSLSQEELERLSRDPIFSYCRNNNAYDLSLRITIDPASRDLEDIGKCTPLTLACMYKAYDAAVYLIRVGADVYHRDNAGYLPFDYIRNDKEKERLKYEYWLTTNEAHDHFKSIEDAWQLQLSELQKYQVPDIIDAAMDGDLDAIKNYLISNSNMIHLRDHMGNTPLLAAAAMQRFEVAQFLLEKGADVNARTNNGQSVLSLARGPKKRKQLAFLAEAATIEYKAQEYAKALFTVCVDHAFARMEIEAVWQIKKIEAEKLARWNSMVARLQHDTAADTVDNVIISATEASFIHFMVVEENRLSTLQTKVTNAINEEYIQVDGERLDYLRWKIDIENKAKASAKTRRQQDKEIEEAAYASTTSFLRRTFAAKTVEEERAMSYAGNRVRRLYAKYEEKKEMKLRAKDLKLKPRKAELAARISQSLRMSMK